MIINILITLILFTVIITVGILYYPQIEKLLEEKLQLRLSTSSENHGILGEIFYKYNHKNSKAWTEWIRTQDNEDQNYAVELLVKHIEMDPGSWGGITYEAIIALGNFDSQEFLDYFKNLLVRCKKFWKKYKICEKIYEAGLISAIKINEEEAFNIFSHEINKLSMESQADPIIKAMQEFSEETDLGPLIVSILRNERISYKSKRDIMNFITVKSEEKAYKIIVEACDLYLNKKNTFQLDELKLIDDFLQTIILNLDDEGFKVILKCCNNLHTSATGVRIAEKNIKMNPELFNPEQIYNLMFTQFDKNNIIEITLAEQKNLNAEEKKLIQYSNIEKEYSFSKGPMVEEELSSAIEIPAIAYDLFNAFKISSKQASMSQQGAGGLLLTGDCDLEKLTFVRAIASERRWRFFYASVEDMLGSSSSSTLRTLMERMAVSKPCLVFLDGVEILMQKNSDELSRNFVQSLADPMLTLIGATSFNPEIDEESSYTLAEENEIIETLFPKAFAINSPDEAEKNIILGNKLTKLEVTREHQNYEQYKILDSTSGMGLFGFNSYLSKYFKASLLTAGKLIDSKEYLGLEKSREKYTG
jgi:hypothetical protein